MAGAVEACWGGSCIAVPSRTNKDFLATRHRLPIGAVQRPGSSRSPRQRPGETMERKRPHWQPRKKPNPGLDSVAVVGDTLSAFYSWRYSTSRWRNGRILQQ